MRFANDATAISIVPCCTRCMGQEAVLHALTHQGDDPAYTALIATLYKAQLASANDNREFEIWILFDQRKLCETGFIFLLHEDHLRVTWRKCFAPCCCCVTMETSIRKFIHMPCILLSGAQI